MAVIALGAKMAEGRRHRHPRRGRRLQAGLSRAGRRDAECRPRVRPGPQVAARLRGLCRADRRACSEASRPCWRSCSTACSTSPRPTGRCGPRRTRRISRKVAGIFGFSGHDFDRLRAEPSRRLTRADPYEILGVEQWTSTDAEIKAVYRKLVRDTPSGPADRQGPAGGIHRRRHREGGDHQCRLGQDRSHGARHQLSGRGGGRRRAQLARPHDRRCRRSACSGRHAVVWGFNFAVAKAGLSSHAADRLRGRCASPSSAIMLLPFLRWPQRRFRGSRRCCSVVLGVVHFSLMFTRHARPRRLHRRHRHPAAGAVRGHPGGDLLQGQRCIGGA